MFNYIKGIITECSLNSITVEVGGIGYDIVATNTLINGLSVGTDAKIHTYMNVREDGITLFGFSDKQEKDMFLRLINISGIGPKAGISILSGISINDLIVSIVTADTNKLSKIKGIGKKTAERIVLELKDKLNVEFDISGMETTTVALDDDAVLALVSLGYTKQEAVTSISRVAKDGLSTEEIIMKALKG